jgi:hypothetical protein
MLYAEGNGVRGKGSQRVAQGGREEDEVGESRFSCLMLCLTMGPKQTMAPCTLSISGTLSAIKYSDRAWLTQR